MFVIYSYIFIKYSYRVKLEKVDNDFVKNLFFFWEKEFCLMKYILFNGYIGFDNVR